MNTLSGYERSLEAVRSLSEGRRKLSAVQTVPVQERVVACAPAAGLQPLDWSNLVKRPEQPEARTRLSPEALGAMVEQWRQRIQQAPFTSVQLADFMEGLGWRVKNPNHAAGHMLVRLSLEGAVEEVGERVGRGGLITWRFVS